MLQQEGTVEEYREKFEELKAFKSHSYRALNEEYHLKSFISGLKEELQDLVMVQDEFQDFISSLYYCQVTGVR